MSCAVKKYTYQRRRPEETPCYKIVQAELSTFIEQRHIEGRPLPSYITDEFEAYLRCGILAHGFLRLKCESCKERVRESIADVYTITGFLGDSSPYN